MVIVCHGVKRVRKTFKKFEFCTWKNCYQFHTLFCTIFNIFLLFSFEMCQNLNFEITNCQFFDTKNDLQFSILLQFGEYKNQKRNDGGRSQIPVASSNIFTNCDEVRTRSQYTKI